MGPAKARERWRRLGGACSFVIDRAVKAIPEDARLRLLVKKCAEDLNVPNPSSP
jgi:hypothetical protein